MEATQRSIMSNNIGAIKEIIFRREYSSSTDKNIRKSTRKRKTIVLEIKEHMMTLWVLIQVHQSKHTIVIAGKNMKRKGIEIRGNLLKETEAIVLIKRNIIEDDLLTKIIKININTINHFKTLILSSHDFQKTIYRG